MRRGEIVWRVYRSDLVISLSERPEVSAVAKLQAQESWLLTMALHSLVMIDNAMTREGVAKIDGTRTIGQLQAEVNSINNSNRQGHAEPPDVIELLTKLANAALLVA